MPTEDELTDVIIELQSLLKFYAPKPEGCSRCPMHHQPCAEPDSWLACAWIDDEKST